MIMNILSALSRDIDFCLAGTIIMIINILSALSREFCLAGTIIMIMNILNASSWDIELSCWNSVLRD